MRVAVGQLANQLKKQTPKVLLLNGNETLLLEEALDVIRDHYRNKGFVERNSYAVDVKFEWSQLEQASQNMSLFSESRLIELRIPTAKPGSKGAKYFEALTQTIAFGEMHDAVVVITAGLSKAQRKAKWVNAIDAAGWIVDSYEVKTDQLPQWLKTRFQNRALRVEAGVIDTLANFTEGNLLAAAQIIDQLFVLASDGAVPMELLKQTLEDQSRFTVYSLVDSCLLGIVDDCLHRLERIRTEADNAVLVVWSLAKETRELLRMANDINSGMNISSVMQKNRVWSTRQRFVGAALNRLSRQDLIEILQRIVQLDAIAKGQQPGDIWHELEKLCLRFCAIETLPLVENNNSYAH